jgi:hypothetical protein
MRCFNPMFISKWIINFFLLQRLLPHTKSQSSHRIDYNLILSFGGAGLGGLGGGISIEVGLGGFGGGES